MWLPGARLGIVSGDTPRSCPSTDTFAPDGSVRTCRSPVVATAVFGISTNCEICVLAVTLTVIVRCTPSFDSSIVCGPTGSDAVVGVWPCAWPSMTTFAPAGSVLTTTVPLTTGSGDALPDDEKYLAAMTPPDVSATSTTAAAINRGQTLDCARAFRWGTAVCGISASSSLINRGGGVTRGLGGAATTGLGLGSSTFSDAPIGMSSMCGSGSGIGGGAGTGTGGITMAIGVVGSGLLRTGSDFAFTGSGLAASIGSNFEYSRRNASSFAREAS